jgi:hypothetical protein
MTARVRSTMSVHPYVTASIALVGGALLVFVLAYFQPQKLFITKTVNEPSPAVPPRAGPEAPGAPGAAFRTLSTGRFRSYEHASSGRATVVRLPDSRRYVRFEPFRTSNGPDLRVYLSATPATGPAERFDSDYVELGHLKGNVGNQNYGIPAGLELRRFRSVVVWCKRFSVAFAAAPVQVQS